MPTGKTKEGTFATVVTKAHAAVGIMADGSAGPHVVHSPHHGLAAVENLAERTKRKKALVDPMQMNDICLTEFRCPGNVVACVGNGNGVKILATEEVGDPDDKALKNETEHPPPSAYA